MSVPGDHTPRPDAAQKNVRTSRRLPKVLTRDEAAAILAVPNLDTPTGLRNRSLLELMYHCGMRVGESVGIHVRDVKWKEELIHLRPEVTKGSKEAYVPVPAATMEILERWKAVRRGYAAGLPELLTTLKGRPLQRSGAYQTVRTLARRAGIDRPVHPHMLRHSFATHALGDGRYSIAEVQQILRHSDVKTTMIYQHVDPAELRRKARDWS